MGQAYATILSEKTYLRLKNSDNERLLQCHYCREPLKVGQKVIFNLGSSHKRYHVDPCGTRLNFDYVDRTLDPPKSKTEMAEEPSGEIVEETEVKPAKTKAKKK